MAGFSGPRLDTEIETQDNKTTMAGRSLPSFVAFVVSILQIAYAFRAPISIVENGSPKYSVHSFVKHRAAKRTCCSLRSTDQNKLIDVLRETMRDKGSANDRVEDQNSNGTLRIEKWSGDTSLASPSDSDNRTLFLWLPGLDGTAVSGKYSYHAKIACDDFMKKYSEKCNLLCRISLKWLQSDKYLL